MNELDWAYIAGLFDGEGCVHSGARAAMPRVIISQRNRKTLDWIMRVTRMGNVTANGPGHYQWMTYAAKDVEKFLFGIFPHCRVKGEQINLALDMLATRVGVGGRYTTEERQAIVSMSRQLMQLKRTA